MPEIKKRFYVPKDLVAMGYASRSTVGRLIQSGDIPTIRVGHRYLIPIEEFEAMLAQGRDDRRREVAAL